MTWLLQYFLMTLLCVTAIFLILLVLVQRGRGGGLAGAFGGMGGQSAFGTKAGDLFTRVTIGVAAFWIILCAASVKLLETSGSHLSSSLGKTAAPAGPGETPPGKAGAAPASGEKATGEKGEGEKAAGEKAEGEKPAAPAEKSGPMAEAAPETPAPKASTPAEAPDTPLSTGSAPATAPPVTTPPPAKPAAGK